MSRRRLYEFPQSHYCEVVRWSMDYKGLPWESKLPLPAWHIVVAKLLGCPATTLPILQEGEVVIQDSAAIVDYLEETTPEPSLTPDIASEEVRQLEAEMSDRLAAPLRQLAYSHLLKQPDVIRYLFMHRSGAFKQALFPFLYPVLKRKLRSAYVCTPEGQASAEAALTAAIAHYDAQLADRLYFSGDRFTRLDLTFAAMLAPAALPPEHPVPWPDNMRNSAFVQWFAQFADGPALQHVRRVYREHRR